jgi:hypothetical protein
VKWLILFVDMHNRELIIKRRIVKWTGPLRHIFALNNCLFFPILVLVHLLLSYPIFA